MKISIISILLILLSFYCFSQTNTFPNSGNVGIGTVDPSVELDVRGAIYSEKFQIRTPSSGSWFNITSINGSNRLDFNKVNAGDISLMSISATGNVGIGTENPLSRLHIKYSTSSEGLLVLQRTNTSSSNYIRGKNHDGTNAWFIGNGSSNNDTYFRNYLNGRMYFGTGGRNDFTISNDGNVGIGTTNPASKLSVYRFDGISKAQIYTNQHAGTAKLEIAGGVASFGELYSGWTISHSNNNTKKDLYFGYGFNEDTKVVFSDEGNVGIGFSEPTYKLSVNGIISSTEVRVSTTPNSDYVFEPDYNLLPIIEVETFIKENKHLPEIPSAEEFKENGVGLGEMDDMLLRKVEELTLYIIQQNKELNDQNKLLEELQIENEQLQTENSNKEAKIDSLEEKVDMILEMLEASK